MSLIEVSQLLGNFGEFFGAVAVVATLVYLASQLRQNTKALRSSTYEAYANSGTAINDFFGRHADALRTVMLGDMDGFMDRVNAGSATTEDLIFINYAHRNFSLMEATYLHHREGSLADDVYEARIRGFAQAFSQQPGLRRIWEDGQDLGYTEAFKQLVKTHIIRGDV